ncbi:MAG: CPBP family intramembrane glutamic endopeptidase [Bacteroidota bacterium]
MPSLITDFFISENHKKHPVIFSIGVVLLIIIINKIPLGVFLSSYELPDYYTEKVENIIINCVVIFSIIKLMYSKLISINLKKEINFRTFVFYIPLIAYIFVFAGQGFNTFLTIDFNLIPLKKVLIYSTEVFTAALLEEVLFRGLILGLLLAKYYQTKNGILKSVVLSGLIFGSVHIINIITKPYGITTGGVFNQIYAASCLGVMYAATYVKTRNIIFLALLHFASNFFAGIGELLPQEEIVDTIVKEKSTIEIILSHTFRVIIFGIPLLIGLFLTSKTNENDVKKLIA